MLKLPKQVHTLEMCWVSKPIFPGFMGNFDVIQMLIIGFECPHDLYVVRAASEGLGCMNGAFTWVCFSFQYSSLVAVLPVISHMWADDQPAGALVVWEELLSCLRLFN